MKYENMKNTKYEKYGGKKYENMPSTWPRRSACFVIEPLAVSKDDYPL